MLNQRLDRIEETLARIEALLTPKPQAETKWPEPETMASVTLQPLDGAEDITG